LSQHETSRRGVRLAYQRGGASDNPTVLLIQGLGLPGAMWLGLAGGLAKSGHLVITPDNRGTGQSDAPRGPYTMGMLAADMVAVLDHAGVERALVVGLSLGGMIAQRLALDHPARVGGLVLAATTCGVPYGRPVRPRTLGVLVQSLSGNPAAIRRVRGLVVHSDSLARNPDLFRHWDRIMKKKPPRPAGFLGQLAAAAGHHAGLSLGRIACPTEVVAGEDDALIPPENSRILARRIPGARLTMLPRAGHAFPLEQPGALPQAIARVRARM
jgi:3-oxoadipate enol-lactonase